MTMAYTIEFGGDPQDITVTTSGQANVSGLESFLEELVSDPRFDSSMVVLLDHSELDLGSLRAPDIEAIAEFVLDLGDRLGHPLTAHVTPTQEGFGLTRMAQVRAGRDPTAVKSSLPATMPWLGWLKSSTRRRTRLAVHERGRTCRLAGHVVLRREPRHSRISVTGGSGSRPC